MARPPVPKNGPPEMLLPGLARLLPADVAADLHADIGAGDVVEPCAPYEANSFTYWGICPHDGNAVVFRGQLSSKTGLEIFAVRSPECAVDFMLRQNPTRALARAPSVSRQPLGQMRTCCCSSTA